MERDIERILISRKRISERVSALADSIGETYGADSEGLVIVPILAGSVIFLADLIRCLPFKMKIGLMTVSSYRGKTPADAPPTPSTANLGARHPAHSDLFTVFSQRFDHTAEAARTAVEAGLTCRFQYALNVPQVFQTPVDVGQPIID